MKMLHNIVHIQNRIKRLVARLQGQKKHNV